MKREKNRMEIESINAEFSVCKVEDYSDVRLDAAYCFTGKTDEEHSLVCITEDVPMNTMEREDGWKAFRIRGGIGFFFNRNIIQNLYGSGRCTDWNLCHIYL